MLVVRRRVRVWDEDRRASRGGQLEHGATGSRQHQVAGRQGVCQTRLVLEERVALAPARRGETFPRHPVVPCPGDLKHVIGAVAGGRAVGEEGVQGAYVDRARALAAAEHE